MNSQNTKVKIQNYKAQMKSSSKTLISPIFLRLQKAQMHVSLILPKCLPMSECHNSQPEVLYYPIIL